MFDTNEIRARNPLLETIEHEAGVQFKKTGGWNMAFCPLHSNSHTPSLGVKDDSYHCFGNCDPGRSHGDVITFIMHYKNMTFVEACQYLGGDKQINPEEVAQATAARKAENQRQAEAEMKSLAERRLAFGASRLWEQYNKALDVQARSWWTQQGVCDDQWQDYWQLGVVPNLWDHGTAYSIPFFSANGTAVTMQYRFKNPNGLGKYRVEPDLGAYAFIARPDMKFDKILVVEGAKKAMVGHLLGTNGQMQTIGYWSESYLGGPEVDDLLVHAKSVWWWPDPGEQAMNWALKHIARLGIESKTKIVRFHAKIDDALLSGMTSQNVSSILKQSRRVK